MRLTLVLTLPSLFSPRVDEKGNSVCGVAAFKEIANEFGLHVFDSSNFGSTCIRSIV